MPDWFNRPVRVLRLKIKDISPLGAGALRVPFDLTDCRKTNHYDRTVSPALFPERKMPNQAFLIGAQLFSSAFFAALR
jgi:hypothetical protein